ncbi:MAG TPA: AMP-binding protein, partial [Ilumatobacteraceae bacterium]|nr:AMP-binding protein [Ilumatobacteraceae bacterium]
DLPCGMLQGYGLTEGCPALTMLSPQEHCQFAFDDALRHRLGSIGRPVPGVHVRIVTENGERVAPGRPGELQVRSTKAMNGYWHAADDSEVFADGWLRTGDIVIEDDDGYLFLVDRAKNMLISGGFNVYPSEIERVLTTSPTVREAAVVGAPDDRWGEVPVAFVVAREGELSDADIAELAARCADGLAKYKQPKRFVRLPALPRNPTGKVSIPELRRQAAALP